MTSRYNIVLKAVTHGDDIRICHRCADDVGGQWPEGHKASFCGGTCHVCQQKKSVCALSDWEWPKSWPNKLDREL